MRAAPPARAASQISDRRSHGGRPDQAARACPERKRPSGRYLAGAGSRSSPSRRRAGWLARSPAAGADGGRRHRAPPTGRDRSRRNGPAHRPGRPRPAEAGSPRWRRPAGLAMSARWSSTTLRRKRRCSSLPCHRRIWSRPADTAPCPRVGAERHRPLDAYARPSETNPGDIRIAIVVGGLGIDADGTKQAIGTLPGTVTLAFAPYGNDLAADTAAARVAGHELLLQIPLEPFNYPKTDPGPNTLTANASADREPRPPALAPRPHDQLRRRHQLHGRPLHRRGRRADAGDAGDRRARPPLSRRRLVGAQQGRRGGRRHHAVPARRHRARRRPQRRRRSTIASPSFAPSPASAATPSPPPPPFPITIERIAAFAKSAADKGIRLVPVSALVPGRS